MIWLPAAIVLASLAQQDDAGFESARVDGANLADTIGMRGFRYA